MAELPPVPHLLLMGFTRCGTSTLQAVLSQDPRFSYGEAKEPHALTTSVDVEWSYRENYRLSRARVLVDGSTSYALQPERVRSWLELTRHEGLQDPVLAVALRHPAERALSAFQYQKAIGNLSPEDSFGDCMPLEAKDMTREELRAWEVHRARTQMAGGKWRSTPGWAHCGFPYNFLGEGFYDENINQIEKAAAPAQVHAVRFEDICHGQSTVYADTCRMVGLAPTADVGNRTFHRNPTLVPRRQRLTRQLAPARTLAKRFAGPLASRMAPAYHAAFEAAPSRALSEGLASRLLGIYRDDVQALGRRTGWDLRSWERWDGARAASRVPGRAASTCE